MCNCECIQQVKISVTSVDIYFVELVDSFFPDEQRRIKIFSFLPCFVLKGDHGI